MICRGCVQKLPRSTVRKAKVVRTESRGDRTVRIYQCPHCDGRFGTIEMMRDSLGRLEALDRVVGKIARQFYGSTESGFED